MMDLQIAHILISVIANRYAKEYHFSSVKTAIVTYLFPVYCAAENLLHVLQTNN